jgi:hypothetical protein
VSMRIYPAALAADNFPGFPIPAYRALTEPDSRAIKGLSNVSKCLNILVPVAGVEPATY